MANLQKYRTHESLNFTTAANWEVQSRQSIASAAHVVFKITKTNQIGFYSDSDIYIRFDNSASDTIDINNDLIIDGEGLVFFNVPRQLGDNGDGIYFHVKQVSSASSKYIRMVYL